MREIEVDPLGQNLFRYRGNLARDPIAALLSLPLYVFFVLIPLAVWLFYALTY